MNTLFIFLVRRDQAAQLVGYVLISLLVIALQVGFTGATRREAGAPALVRAADAAPTR